MAYIVCNVLAMKNTPAPEEEEQAEEGPFAKELGLLAIGAVLIAVGADLLVDNGTLIAQALGVPESVIALTFVALGTSLPELVTAITSLAKGHGALSQSARMSARLCLLCCLRSNIRGNWKRAKKASTAFPKRRDACKGVCCPSPAVLVLQDSPRARIALSPDGISAALCRGIPS